MRLYDRLRAVLAYFPSVPSHVVYTADPPPNSFGFPLFAPAMYAALGVGWGDTLLAFVAIIVGCPA